MEDILSAHDLVKRYADSDPPVISNLSLSFKTGEFAVIMGSSGAGKSTLLYLLCGLDKPNTGVVLFGDVDLTRFSENTAAIHRRTHMGFIFQDAGLVPQLTILENVVVPGCLIEKDRKSVLEQARELLCKTGILDLAARLPAEISSGEQQRCAIARALINSPDIVFADEPTGNLNSAHSQTVLDLLEELNRDGQTVIMVTHELRAACRGNRVLFLKDGCVEDTYTPAKGSLEEKEEKMFQWLTGLGW